MNQIGGGFEHNGTISLTTSPTAYTTNISLQLHRHIGHPSLIVLYCQFPDIPISEVLECESCQLSKHHRNYFPSRKEKCVTTTFDLVHADIWEPCLRLEQQAFQTLSYSY